MNRRRRGLCRNHLFSNGLNSVQWVFKKERGEITATFERKRDAKAREKDNPEDEDYYIEFNMKQQRKFENCIIDNQSVIKPERLICLSNIRISDMRKFVYFRVLD